MNIALIQVDKEQNIFIICFDKRKKIIRIGDTSLDYLMINIRRKKLNPCYVVCVESIDHDQIFTIGVCYIWPFDTKRSDWTVLYFLVVHSCQLSFFKIIQRLCLNLFAFLVCYGIDIETLAFKTQNTNL